MVKNNICALILVFILLSCDQEFIIDSRLQPHYESFKQKAISYGIDVTNDNLLLVLKQDMLKNEKLYGLTVRNIGAFTDKQLTVYIASEVLEKDFKFIETVVYHELGHALLLRDHQNYYPSLMNTSTTYLGYKDRFGNYSKELEKQLIEELFNPIQK